MLYEYLPILIFLALALLFASVMLSAGFIFGGSNPDDEKNSPYECGFEPFEDSRMKFDVRFYLVAILFIIFDLEIAFLFPWAVVYQDFIASGQGLLVLVEMLLFVVILTIGFAYVWVKGDLDWVKMKLKYAHGRYSNLGIDK